MRDEEEREAPPRDDMTRDLFAAIAILRVGHADKPAELARDAYAIADAMMLERSGEAAEAREAAREADEKAKAKK